MYSLIELFKTLAQTDSISGEESHVASLIVKFLKDLGLQPKLLNSGMVYCRIGAGEPVLLCAHMDTVEPGRSIKVQELNGFLQSNGTTIVGGDNKASLASMLFTVQELVRENRDLNLELLFSVREETNSGIQELNKGLLKSKVGFIFDGGGAQLGWCVTQASTIQDLEIEFFGKSTHASTPELGQNVLEALMNLGSRIKLGRLDQFTTFNLGIISGGSATNTIPEYMKLQGDLRSSSNNSFQKYKEEIEKKVNLVCLQFNITSKFNWIPYAYGYELNKESREYLKLKDIYHNAGIEILPTATTSGSDAGYLNSIGITTFCLGDGVEGIHTLGERIEIKKFHKLQELMESIILNFKP